ncbi:serine hydrolase domain-containing protein [Urechidicola vernalis]|uniref:Serine hydrolase domain-containing protein n=1 Tax=Urechidicola vernalis TaxID=3075600 RepID=A0ABU2Y8E3_9FLAO|nr:serine hydrolase domain-containing protein [Urechidicola sp. P050]MDT0553919.1 serine hydrolase domain-containing protein [Urechidicola sp. P050]
MKNSINKFLSALIILGCSLQVFSQQKEQISQAQKIVNDFLVEEQIPGMAISVSKGKKLIWSQGFGFMDVENNKKVDPATTQFRIASISKTLTALGMGILVDENRLDFDASVYAYIPDYPKKKYDFTVRQVAGHIAGIRHYKKDEFLMNKKMDIVEGLAIFKDDPLLFEPGSEYKYSTYGWNLLSVVVQNAEGEEFNQFMKRKVFSPLKMSATEIGISDIDMPNRTKFYIKQNGKIEVGPQVNNEFKVAGGGFISTSEDLVKFGQEFINPNIISEETKQDIVTPLLKNDGTKTKYGVGIGVLTVANNTLRYSHSGGGMGATTMLLIYPEKDLVITILTNLSSVNIRKLVGELEGVFVL